MISKSHFSAETDIPNGERASTSSYRASRKGILALVLVVAPALLLVLYSKTVFPGLTHTGALDFAQLGRNIGAGRGMVTYVLHPLALTHGADALRQPDSTHGPLFPFLLALAFGVAGARDAVASGVSGLFYLLTIPMLYVLGLRVFNRTIGSVAAAAFAFSSLSLEYAVSGLHITLYTFLVTSLSLVLYNLAAAGKAQAPPTESPLPTNLLLLAGTFMGLLYLTDAVFIWLLPVVLGGIIRIAGPSQRAATVKFLLPLGALILPWMVRNGMVTGSPLFGLRGAEIWMYTDHYFPGRVAYRMFPEEFVRGVYLIPAVIKKVLFGLNTVVRVLPEISNAWLLAFLLPCLFFGYTSTAATLLRRLMLFSFVALLFGMLLFQVEMPLFHALVPTMLVFAVAYLNHLIKQAALSPFARWTTAALLGVTVAYPLLSQMFLEPKALALPEAVSARALGRMAQSQQVVLSDRPDVVAWYADRPSVQLPADDSRLADIRTRFPETRWIFLTSGAREQSSQWQYLYDRCVLWNTAYLNAQRTNSRVPPFIRISGSVQPLYKILEGFTSISPAPDASPSTVLAALPETKSSLDSQSARDRAR